MDVLGLLIALLVVGAVVALLRLLPSAVGKATAYSERSRTPLYAADREQVRAAVIASVDRAAGWAVCDIEEDSISFSTGSHDGTAVMPVVHVVMLPKRDGRTQVEVIGGRRLLPFGWNLMAQKFLERLDEAVSRGEEDSG